MKMIGRNAGRFLFIDQTKWIAATIRKVDTSGTITTVAGNGNFANAAVSDIGDGGAATSASLGGALRGGLAVDSAGNLFISDEENNRVRRVDTNGIITTV